MKRIILLVAAIHAGIYAQSQDCKGVKTTNDELAGIKKIESPISFMGPKIQAVKISKSGKEAAFIYFSLTWPVQNLSAKGILLKLSDSTFIREENINVTCSYVSATGSYMYSGSIPMNDEYIERLSKNKISVFRVGEGQNLVGDKFATKFMDYVKCVYSSK